MNSNHDIRVQSWGRDAVVTCESCPVDKPADKALIRATSANGVPWVEAVAAIEKHIGEGAFRVGPYQRVEGQVEFGTVPTLADGSPLPTEEPPLVAYGPPDEFPEGYHPRTGQKLDQGTGYEAGSYPQAKPFLTPGNGGPSLREYLESKGEI